MSGICSTVEGKSGDEDHHADHFEVGGRNEGHEDHAEGRHQKGKSSVHLNKASGKETFSTINVSEMLVAPQLVSFREGIG